MPARIPRLLVGLGLLLTGVALLYAQEADPPAHADDSGAVSTTSAADASAPQDASGAGADDADAGAAPAAPAASDGRWHVSVTPGLWLAGVDGDVRVRGTSSDVENGPFDGIDDGDVGVFVNAEVRKDAHQGWVELFGFGVRDDHARVTGGAAADVDLEQSFVEAAYARAIDDEGTLDLYGGLRRWRVDAEIDLETGPSVSERERFTDPFVGLRKRWTLDDDWRLVARGDVGGLNLGDASDLSLQFLAQAERRLDENASWMIGWRVLDVDHDEGAASEQDVTFQGLVTGVTVRF